MNITVTDRADKGLDSLRARYNTTNKTALTTAQFCATLLEAEGNTEMDRLRDLRRATAKEFTDRFTAATAAQKAAALAALPAIA